MNSSNSTKDQIIEKINQAFTDTKYPGDDHLIRSDTYRDNEVNECEMKFKGKSWQEIDWHTIDTEEWASGRAFLSDEAYRYYLPAYMIAIIEHYNDMSSVDVVVNSLISPDISDDHTMKDWLKNSELIKSRKEYVEFAERHTDAIDVNIEHIDERVKDFYDFIDGFTEDQKHAIRLFLEWIQEIDTDSFFVPNDPATALGRYWGTI